MLSFRYFFITSSNLSTLSFFIADIGTISTKLYKSLYSAIFNNICSFGSLSILFRTRITGLFISFSMSMINLSPLPKGVDMSTTNNITSVSFMEKYASLLSNLPNLFLGLWIPGVSTKTIWVSSSLYIPWMLFLVVWGLLEVIAIFLPMMVFNRLLLPTFGLPIIPTKPLFIVNPHFQICKGIVHLLLLFDSRLYCYN